MSADRERRERPSASSERAGRPDGTETSPTGLFRSIVAEADEGVLVLGPDGRAAYANPAAEFLLGYGREELTREMFGLARAANLRAATVNVVSRDGQVRVVDLRVEPLPTPAGSLVLRMTDVTGYHREVVDAREQVRRRDEFLAMLSHEVRNPFAAIRYAAQVLARDDLDRDSRRATVEVLDRQFRHLARILDDLLDMTRVSRGKLEIVREPAELTRIVRDAIDEALPLIESRGHRLCVRFPEGEIRLVGDATRLGQVVVNLLNNAAKFTPEGGNLDVEVIVNRDLGQAIVRVGDDGPGIAPELLPNVFEPFIQGEQSMARDLGGLGIGLALAREIIRLHGGTIEADAESEAKGTTFTFRLPTTRQNHGDGDADGDGQETGLGSAALVPRRKILVVEDQTDVRRLLRRLLEMDGHEVIEASDGPGGLSAILEHRPDIALLDIGLPGLDGYEVARRARQDERGRSVRLIALTGYGLPRDVQEARNAGFDGHLVKPLNYPDLARILAEGDGS